VTDDVLLQSQCELSLPGPPTEAHRADSVIRSSTQIIMKQRMDGRIEGVSYKRRLFRVNQGFACLTNFQDEKYALGSRHGSKKTTMDHTDYMIGREQPGIFPSV
jgi:hypothetical protein